MNINDGTYYSTKTLLGGDVDVNRRYIYCWPNSSPVVIMNFNMEPWTEEQENILDAILKMLNERKLKHERRIVD
jgi:hypothetical protein